MKFDSKQFCVEDSVEDCDIVIDNRSCIRQSKKLILGKMEIYYPTFELISSLASLSTARIRKKQQQHREYKRQHTTHTIQQ